VEQVDRVQGTVQWFRADKGYGFLTPDDGGDSVFVHVSAVQDEGVEALVQGQRVEYTLVEGERGQQADEVHLLGTRIDDAQQPPLEGGIRGRVQWYDADKGFGFLSRDDGEPDVFVHSSVLGARRWLDEGERVEFVVGEGPRGPQAEQVRVLPDDDADTGRIVVSGTVHWFDEAKGFGFISPDDVFVHATSISGSTGAKVLFEGQQVQFVLVPGERGLQAERVRVTGDAAPRRQERGRDERGRDERFGGDRHRDDRGPRRDDRGSRWDDRGPRRDDRGPRRDDARRHTGGGGSGGGNGTVAWFKAEKGFGFITPDDGGEDVFVHFREIADTGGFRTLSEGQRVHYRVDQTDRGPHARDVRPA